MAALAATLVAIVGIIIIWILVIFPARIRNKQPVSTINQIQQDIIDTSSQSITPESIIPLSQEQVDPAMVIVPDPVLENELPDTVNPTDEQVLDNN
jgi:hypothetical protein